MPRRTISIFGSALLLLGAACSKAPPATSTPSVPALQVRIAPVRVVEQPVSIEVFGTARPVQRAQVAARLLGVVEELPVALGQPVRAGDLIAKIAVEETAARLAQSLAQLNLVRRDLDRERALLAQGASTAETVRGLEDRLALTQALVREAEAMAGYATIRAPFDGVIARKPAEAGDLASPGLTLVEIEGRGAFQIEVPVPDSLAAGIHLGTTLVVSSPSGATFSAPVAEFSSAADPGARTVLVRLSVPAGTPVRSGQFFRVGVSGPVARTLLVPVSALTVFGQMERVFVVGEHPRATLRLVKSGGQSPGGDPAGIEIVSGLTAGERVIVDPPATLRDGQPLEVVP